MSKSSPVYLLDTNVCIMYLKGKSLSIKNRLENLDSQKIAVCSVVKAELFYGSRKSHNPQKFLNLQTSFLSQFVSFPFDDTCAEIYGKVCGDLARAGTPIGSNDLQIASIALVQDLILVTHNVREFSRVEGLSD